MDSSFVAWMGPQPVARGGMCPNLATLPVVCPAGHLCEERSGSPACYQGSPPECDRCGVCILPARTQSFHHCSVCYVDVCRDCAKKPRGRAEVVTG